MRAVVVEDQAAIRTLLAELLRSEGFTVETFSNTSSWNPEKDAAHLQIVDWNLPEGTAEPWIRRLMSASPTSTCLVVSGCVVDLSTFPAEWQPRLGFLEKPFTAAMLRQVVSALVTPSSSRS